MTTATEATQRTTPTGTWSVDPVHSRVEFHVQHNGIAPYRGSFSDYEVRLVGEENGSVAVEGSAKVASISGEDENLYGHLQSPEFFDTERYPEIKFRSTDVKLGDAGELTVTGDLTIRDQTKAVEARGRISGPGPNLGGQNVVAVYLEAVVDRNEFGLGWNMDLPNGTKVLGDDVTLTVSLELVEEA
jgi:polyisoprenoid-binding protein YceI